MIEITNNKINLGSYVLDYEAFCITDKDNNPISLNVMLSKDGYRGVYAVICQDGKLNREIIYQNKRFADVYDIGYNFYSVNSETIRVDASFNF